MRCINSSFRPWKRFRDFRFTVSTNRLGFRGPDFPIHRTPGVKRILVFGNSFTYGWGVDFEETWPRLLERELSAAGISAQVANLSCAATNGMEMKEIVERSIPLLKPDLIIISVLQGGVLTTLQSGVAPNPTREREKNVKGILAHWLSYVMPNYVQLLQVVRQRSAAACGGSRRQPRRRTRGRVVAVDGTVVDVGAVAP